MLVASDNAGAGIGVVVLVLIGIACYFIPTLVAVLRHVPNIGSVAVVNVFLGWTFIGWVVALAMACRSGGHSTVVNVGAPVPAGVPTSPAGWYPDPQTPGVQRYWNGSTWTDQTQTN